MSDVPIPTIDLTSFATDLGATTAAGRETATELDTALREVGFVLVTGHGLDADVRERYFAAMHAFFAQPIRAKESIAIANSPVHRGYVGIGAETLEGALAGDDETLGSAAGDLKETLDTGTEHGPDHPEVVAGTPLHGPNQLPALPGFFEAWDAYREAMVEVVLRMQRAMAVGLGLPPDFFEMQPGETMYHLRMIHYPPMDRVTPEPGQLGCGSHTDYGSLTVLADDGVGGLQVRQRSGEWTDVIIPDDHLVVNIGDLMAIWTNDRWVSNAHRVVNPQGVDRYSSPMFVTPPFHLRIEAIPTCVPEGRQPHHDPIVSGPYLLGRFDGTHDYRAAEPADLPPIVTSVPGTDVTIADARLSGGPT